MSEVQEREGAEIWSRWAAQITRARHMKPSEGRRGAGWPWGLWEGAAPLRSSEGSCCSGIKLFYKD